MFSTRVRTTIITLIAACGLATATVAPAVSQARPVTKTPPRAECTLTTASGGVWVYGDGTVVVITEPNGYQKKFKCNNGRWQRTFAVVDGGGEEWNVPVDGGAINTAGA
jgi:hypothetical protein